jgi:hypothetical protein
MKKQIKSRESIDTTAEPRTKHKCHGGRP